jgi:hypothetical protein
MACQRTITPVIHAPADRQPAIPAETGRLRAAFPVRTGARPNVTMVKKKSLPSIDERLHLGVDTL